MGEPAFEAIYTFKAQTFLLDRGKKAWQPISPEIAKISFMTSVDGLNSKVLALAEDKTVIFDSSIFKSTVFRKPSNAFVQWYDVQTKNMYGLNMTSKNDTKNFEELFLNAISKAPQLRKINSKGSLLDSNESMPQAQINDKNSSERLANTASSKDNQNDSKKREENQLVDKSQHVSIKSSDDEPQELEKSTNIDSNSISSTSPISLKISKKETLNHILDFVSDIESNAGLRNQENDKISQIKEEQLQSLIQKVSKLERENQDLRGKAATSDEKYRNEIQSLRTENNELRTVLDEATRIAEKHKKQVSAYQEVNNKLKVKLKAVSEMYDKLGDILTSK